MKSEMWFNRGFESITHMETFLNTWSVAKTRKISVDSLNDIIQNENWEYLIPSDNFVENIYILLTVLSVCEWLNNI